MSLPEGWSLTGIIDADGTLERKVPSQVILVPDRIDFDPGSGGRLVYSPERHEVMPAPGVLQEFLRLCGQPESQRPLKVVAFARRWGVLGLCEHDLPHTHEPGCYPRGWWDYPDRQLWEPISTWLHLSRAAFAILNIAHKLHQEPPAVGNPTDWAAIFARSGRNAPWWQQRPDVERIILGRVINEWLSLGNVRPSFEWHVSDRTPSVKLAGPGLFGVIATQITYAAAAADAMALCSQCGRAYVPKRRPREGERHYCPDCGTRAAKRHAQAAWRARLRAGRMDGG